jgi:small-conductance mechanosensitive channel
MFGPTIEAFVAASHLFPVAGPAQTRSPTPTPTSAPAAPPEYVPDELAGVWPDLLQAGWFLAGFAVVVLVGWFLLEPAVSRVVEARNRNNPTIEEAVSRYVRLGVTLVALFVGVAAAGFGGVLSTSALVVAAGTLAVGVAGQTVVGSIVSGLVLVVDPEFNVGDYIRWSGGEGTVRSITLRVTRVHTPDGELVTVPNTVLTDEAFTRPYWRGRFRVVVRVGVDYEDDLEATLGHLREAAEGVEGILGAPSPNAYVEEFGGDAVVCRVHYWIEDPNRRDVFAVRSAYARAAKTRLEASGATISPPAKRELLGQVDVGDPAATSPS